MHLLTEVLAELDRNAKADGDAFDITIVGSQAERWRTEHSGSFSAWGADVRVPTEEPDSGNFLPELIARYLLDLARSRVPELGLRTESVAYTEQLPSTPGSGLIVVVVDGSAGLDEKAPLASVPGAQDIHEHMRDFLEQGESFQPAASWTSESLQKAGVIEPYLWEQLVELDRRLVSQGVDVDRKVWEHDSSLGVGRFVAHWQWKNSEVSSR